MFFNNFWKERKCGFAELKPSKNNQDLIIMLFPLSSLKGYCYRFLFSYIFLSGFTRTDVQKRDENV